MKDNRGSAYQHANFWGLETLLRQHQCECPPVEQPVIGFSAQFSSLHNIACPAALPVAQVA